MSQMATTITINPSDETIRLGPLQIRFLVTSDDSCGSAWRCSSSRCPRAKTSRAGP